MSNNESQESRGAVMISPRGLREQVAVAIVNLAQRFQSDILMCAGSLCIDAKSSLMAIMMLGALKGQLLELTARGVDSAQALQELTGVFVTQS